MMRNYEIAIETQGSKWCDWLCLVSLIVISPKLYCYNEKLFYNKFMKKCFNENITNKLCIKIVIFANKYLKKQLIKAKNIRKQYKHILYYISIGNRFLNIKDELIQKKGIIGDYKKILYFILKDEDFQDISILPQMHVLLWGSLKRI